MVGPRSAKVIVEPFRTISCVYIPDRADICIFEPWAPSGLWMDRHRPSNRMKDLHTSDPPPPSIPFVTTQSTSRYP